MRTYIIKDKAGISIKMFHTKKETLDFCAMYARLDEQAKTGLRIQAKSSERQKKAVSFCKKVLKIDFKGNINNKIDCHRYLKMWLDLAKQEYDALRCEYEAYREEYDND